jgi:hypothetical protein
MADDVAVRRTDVAGVVDQSDVDTWQFFFWQIIGCHVAQSRAPRFWLIWPMSKDFMAQGVSNPGPLPLTTT